MAQNYLLERGKRYYFRMKVPVDLREALRKKEIKASLGTSDFREACRKIKLEALKAENLFAEERRKLVQPVAPKAAKVKIGEGEALGLVAKWYAKREQDAEEWLEENLSIFQRPDDLQEALQTLYMDEHAYSGGGLIRGALGPPASGEDLLEEILEDAGAELRLSADATKRLTGVVRRACLEGIRRDILRLQQRRLGEGERIFRQSGEGNSHWQEIASTADNSRSVPLGQFIDDYLAHHKKTERAASTLRTYQAPVRLLREELGESLPLKEIDRAKMAKVRDLILQLPANATKLYPGKTLREASELAKADGRSPIEPKTIENYFRNISAIFNHALELELIFKHPAPGTWLRKSLGGRRAKKKKAVFTSETLRPLLLALTNRSVTKAPKVKRDSGNFWVPLLGLMHGFRLAEACQIYTEDVMEKEGIPCIEISSTRQDGSVCDKRVKNEITERVVPVHPLLIEIGFLAYVEKRQKDAIDPHLFADLAPGASGSYSPFQKWFGRFLEKVLGEGTGLTFHSLRHHWRDAARSGRIETEIAHRLGGWSNGRNVGNSYGNGHSLPLLREEIGKITFPGLEILKET